MRGSQYNKICELSKTFAMLLAFFLFIIVPIFMLIIILYVLVFGK